MMPETGSTQPAVRLENIVKDFSGFRALNDITFQLRPGEILGLLGPNGAGKTTAMRILTGFFPPTRGRVWIHDKELGKNPVRFKKSIGYLPESVHLYGDMRVEEFLKFASVIKAISRRNRARHVREKILQCGLEKVPHRLIGKLSKGYRQRVGLAQALIGDPEILVLDEPTSGLDPKQIIEIRNLIRDLGRQRTLVLSTHILPEVSMVCDRVVIINKGRVVAQGTTRQLESGLKERNEVLITFGDPSKKQLARDLLARFDAVENIHVAAEKSGTITLAFVTARSQDLRAEINRSFMESGIPLIEMKTEQLSLEDIFMKLVTEEKRG